MQELIVWDARNHIALNRLADPNQYRPVNQITGFLFDAAHGCIMLGTTRIRLLSIRQVRVRACSACPNERRIRAGPDRRRAGWSTVGGPCSALKC